MNLKNWYIPEDIVNEIEELKELWKFDEAMRIVNSILLKNPSNEDALLQVADIQYRTWEISKATKAIDFLNAKKLNKDPLWLYIKWVLEMEKNNWLKAKQFLEKALELTNSENYEIIRCYWMCEYRYWNREKWILLLKEAYIMNSNDAEVIYNLIKVYLLEHKFKSAKIMINHYYKNHDELDILDKSLEFYDSRVELFEKYIKVYDLFVNKKNNVK